MKLPYNTTNTDESPALIPITFCRDATHISIERNNQAAKVDLESVFLRYNSAMKIFSLLRLCLFLTCLSLTMVLHAAPDPDVSIASGNTSTIIPFTFENGEIYVSALINGKGPFTFLLDSGSSRNLLDSSLAKTLGLKTNGFAFIGGIGTNTFIIHQTENATIQSGDLSIRQQKFFVIDIKKINGFTPHPVDGILGINIFQKFSVRIDYINHLITLTLPDAFVYNGPGVSLPLTFDHQKAGHLHIKVDGIDAKVLLDTGFYDAVNLNTFFVDRHHLRSKYKTQIHPVTSMGISNKIHGQRVSDVPLTLGSLSASMPLILSSDRFGITNDPDIDGLLGNNCFSKFLVIFDYSHKQIIFEPQPQAAIVPQ